jgi:hypothetical protein
LFIVLSMVSIALSSARRPAGLYVCRFASHVLQLGSDRVGHVLEIRARVVREQPLKHVRLVRHASVVEHLVGDLVEAVSKLRELARLDIGEPGELLGCLCLLAK